MEEPIQGQDGTQANPEEVQPVASPEEGANTGEGAPQAGDQQPEPKEGLEQLVHGLQKGYTQHSQTMADLKRDIATLTELLTPKATNPLDTIAGDEPLTKQQVLDLIAQKEKQQADEGARIEAQNREEQAKIDQYIETSLATLKSQGIIKDKADEDAIVKLAIDNEITDLLKAGKLYQRLQAVELEGAKKGVRTQTRQQAGSMVGSSPQAGTPQGVLDYKKIHSTDMYNL